MKSTEAARVQRAALCWIDDMAMSSMLNGKSGQRQRGVRRLRKPDGGLATV